jgi:hypothetical protein
MGRNDELADKPIHMRYHGGNERSVVLFADGSSESLLVSSVGSGLFRFEESSLLSEYGYSDVFRASEQDDASLLFHEVVSQSSFRTECYLIPRRRVESTDFRSFLDWVMSTGGNWEQVFGDLLVVHVPPDLTDHLHARMECAPQIAGGPIPA